MEIKMMDIHNLKDYADNPRNNDGAIDYVKQSIKEFGFKVPIVVDKDNEIIAGHTRKRAALEIGIKEVPVIIADDLSDEQVRAFRLADNKVAEFSEWDMELLQSELNMLEDLNMDDFGFDMGEDIDDVEDEEIEEDEVVEIPEEAVSKFGQIYQLGNHRLMCGDSTSEEDVSTLMNGEQASLVFTDPPYGAKKQKDGVLNDNLSYDDLLDFNRLWIPLSFKHLKENGSWYCWGLDQPLMDIYTDILKPKIKKGEIDFKNLITWDKGSGQGQNSEGRRQYATADEKCLFVAGDVDSQPDQFYEGYRPVLNALKEQAKKVGLGPKAFREIVGTQMYNHYFSESQFALIPRKVFSKLQSHYGELWELTWEELNNMVNSAEHGYKDFLGEHRRKHSYFNNTHDNMNNVWHINRVISGSEEYKDKGQHVTPKPLALCSRGVKSSSKEEDIVLDLFGGSGSVLISCELSNRMCYTMEYQPQYVDAIIERWERRTGRKAELING